MRRRARRRTCSATAPTPTRQHIKEQLATATDRVDVLEDQQEGRRNEEMLGTAGDVLGDVATGRSIGKVLGGLFGKLGGAAGRRSRSKQSTTHVDARADEGRLVARATLRARRRAVGRHRAGRAGVGGEGRSHRDGRDLPHQDERAPRRPSPALDPYAVAVSPAGRIVTGRPDASGIVVSGSTSMVALADRPGLLPSWPCVTDATPRRTRSSQATVATKDPCSLDTVASSPSAKPRCDASAGWRRRMRPACVCIRPVSDRVAPCHLSTWCEGPTRQPPRPSAAQAERASTRSDPPAALGQHRVAHPAVLDRHVDAV